VKLPVLSLFERAKSENGLLLFCLILFICIAPLAFAHEGESHEPMPQHGGQPKGTFPKEILEKINESYLKNVKPIFQKSCIDCHSNQTKYPWYANIPGAKQLIASDVAEAKTHLDMTEDFPFKGHGSPAEDLEAIRSSVVDNSMPPFRYWILHSGSRIDGKEEKTVLEWVDSSLKWLGESQPKEASK